MAVDPEALQRALRAQFPPPELAPDASDWMREIVAAVGSNPFVHRERDVLKFVEAPLNRLKSEPPEVRLAFVFEALNEIVRSSSFHFKLVLKIVVASLLRSGVALSAVEAVRLVELVSQPKAAVSVQSSSVGDRWRSQDARAPHGAASVARLCHAVITARPR